MLELRFPASVFSEIGHVEKMREIVEHIDQIRNREGNRASNQALIDHLGLMVSPRDEAYCQEALDYHLGLLLAHAGEPQKAAFHFELSKTLPGTGGDKIFSDHAAESLEIRRRQEIGIERSLPCVLIASMPRSGSASLSQTIAELLDLPCARVSCGEYPNYFLVPRWLKIVMSGGVVLHDHFPASEFNLSALRAAGVRNVFVRIRDPRAAAHSFCRWGQQLWPLQFNATIEEQLFKLYSNAYLPWLSEWIAAAADPAHGIRVHWSIYRANSRSIAQGSRDILSMLAADHPALQPYLSKEIPIVDANFVNGEDEAWRRAVGGRCQERLWEATPRAVRELLGMRAKPSRSPTRSAVADREAAAASHERALAQLRAALAEHEAALSERERELSEHRAALADREATLAERDRELAEHQTALAMHVTALAERDRELLENRAALDELHCELAERQTEVEEHRTALADREAALADYRAALGELQGAFAEYNAVGDRELAEHRAALAEQDAKLANREETIAAYGALAAQRDATIAERDSELAEHRGALVERDAVIAEYRAIAAQRDTTIAERERELGEHRTALAYREAQLADRDVELAEHRCALADREGTLVDRDRELAERSGALAERDRELAELRGELADLAHELAESRATLAEREQRLTSLYRSYSWRMTAPVRGVRRLLVGGDTAGQISKSNVDGRG